MQRVPLHEQGADMLALVAPDLGAAVAVDWAAPGALGGDRFGLGARGGSGHGAGLTIENDILGSRITALLYTAWSNLLAKAW